jgi:NADPH:quinone reductase-like Zn-dependent oxidoreductase
LGSCYYSQNKRLDLPNYQGKPRDKFVEIALGPLALGEMKITIDKVYSWTEISDAHKRMEANVNAGKIICIVD